MRAFSTPTGFFVRLDRGEELLGTLTEFLAGQQVASATLSGIGAVEKTTLGYYDLQRREYLRKEYPSSMELVALSGNLAWADGKPFIHAHAVIAGPDNLALGGHLFSATISATGEVTVWIGSQRLQRALDPVTGLKLISDQ